jgi:hypothetical protein
MTAFVIFGLLSVIFGLLCVIFKLTWKLSNYREIRRENLEDYQESLKTKIFEMQRKYKWNINIVLFERTSMSSYCLKVDMLLNNETKLQFHCNKTHFFDTNKNIKHSMDTLDDFITSKFDIIPVSQLPLNRH